MNDRMTVECPHCSERFETHTMGDLVACEACDETFARFPHEVIEDEDVTRNELEPPGDQTTIADIVWPEDDDSSDTEVN